MKNFKISLVFAILVASSNYAIAQKKKRIDFLVDTVNVLKENRIGSISGKGEISYTFFCKCLEPKQDIRFTYLQSAKSLNSFVKPKFKFYTWKGLLDLIDNNVIKFDERYDLYITEVLPGNSYKTNKVFFDWHRTASY